MKTCTGRAVKQSLYTYREFCSVHPRGINHTTPAPEPKKHWPSAEKIGAESEMKVMSTTKSDLLKIIRGNAWTVSVTSPGRLNSVPLNAVPSGRTAWGRTHTRRRAKCQTRRERFLLRQDKKQLLENSPIFTSDSGPKHQSLTRIPVEALTFKFSAHGQSISAQN